MAKRFLVVGAGVGGLGIALRLAHRGHEVTILEKSSEPGGRNKRELVGECAFDSGPTLLMMLDPFRKLFREIGEDFEAAVPHKLCDPSYRVFYADGVRFDATTDLPKLKERVRTMSGQKEADNVPVFLQELKDLYEEAIPNFVRRNYTSVADVARPKLLRSVLKHHMLGNLAQRVERYFKDPKLRMLFSFQTMYLGLSPFDAPWVYATLAHMEYGEGIYYPVGGLSAISRKMLELCEQKGVKFQTNSEVVRIEGKTVFLSDGRSLTADKIISNADLPYTKSSLEGDSLKNYSYSCSAYVMYMDYVGQLDQLEHHNVFFGKDFRGNLNALFHDLDMPQDPAFYACVSKKSDPAVAPAGHSNLFVLVPVPNLSYEASEADFGKVEEHVYQRLAAEVGFDRSKVSAIKRRGPKEWKQELNLENGAAFGISHILRQSAFMRPQNRSKSNPDVYYVGASTVPGNGLPMVLISAELVEQRLIKDGVIPA